MSTPKHEKSGEELLRGMEHPRDRVAERADTVIRLRADNRRLREALDSERGLNNALTKQMTKDAVLGTPFEHVWVVFVNDSVTRVCATRTVAEHYAGVSREKYGGEWSLMHESYDRTRWYQRSSPTGRLISRLEIVQRKVDRFAED